MLTMNEVAGLRRIDSVSSSASSSQPPPPSSPPDGTSRFMSASLPIHMGNQQRIAYGGCTLALSVHAAYQTIPHEATTRQRLRIYSVLGNYLGPTSLDAHVELTVVALRDTKSFATRAVTASQTLVRRDEKTGRELRTTRTCMFVVVDFIATQGTRTIAQYSVQPQELQNGRTLTERDAAPTRQQLAQMAIDKGQLTEQQLAEFRKVFQALEDLTEHVVTPEGVFGQNFHGYLKHVKTTQDDRLITDKTSYDWFKTRRELQVGQCETETGDVLLLPPTPQAASAVLLSFLMDGALSFLPLSYSHRFLSDAQACSSLDLALRFHVDEFDASEWHLREMFTVTGNDERTYSEGRLFRKQENKPTSPASGPYQLVATMTQACVLRGLDESQHTAKL